MKQNKVFSGLFLLSLMLSLTMVSAAITFVTPTSAGDTVTGTYVFNVTTTLGDVTTCNWSTTADGVFNTTANVTTDQTSFNFSFDTTSLTDAEDTTLTVLCSENATSNETNTLTINVDNTAPVCTSALGIGDEIVEYMSGNGVSPTTGATDTTDLTYLWTLFTQGGVSKNTDTTTTPNFASGDLDDIATWTISLTVTDEASQSTACTNLTFETKGTNGVGAGTKLSLPIIGVVDNTMLMIGGLVFIILIVAIAGMLLIMKYKK